MSIIRISLKRNDKIKCIYRNCFAIFEATITDVVEKGFKFSFKLDKVLEPGHGSECPISMEPDKFLCSECIRKNTRGEMALECNTKGYVDTSLLISHGRSLLIEKVKDNLFNINLLYNDRR